jgi:hypothetical protein
VADPVVLWSTPRSISTAFDKMMRSRGDHRVFTEPFSVAYYFGPERISNRFAGQHHPNASYADVWDDVLGAASCGPVFVKEMPHHLGPHLTAETIRRFTSSFLVRDPAWAVPSFAAKWDDVTDDELGYAAQRRAFELAGGSDDPPPVIDADDLRANPDGIVGAWCRAVGIDHRPEALTWPAGMPDGWQLWSDWFERAAASTCFIPPDDRAPPAADPALSARIERCREHFEVLHARRLRP